MAKQMKVDPWPWDDVSLARMEGIKPDLRKILEEARRISPFRFRVTEGLRSIARQRELVRIGASQTMNSRHLTGDAGDVVPYVDLDRDGKIETEELYNWPMIYDLAEVMRQAAINVGIPVEWGACWQIVNGLKGDSEDWIQTYAKLRRAQGKRPFIDGPHWQLPRSVYP